MSAVRRQSLLHLPAEEGARLVALGHLEAAAQARQRLDDPADTEALHDLRVALRRLRSCVRAYKPYLEDSVSKKLRNRLRELAAATTTARDTEVQMAWLSAQRSRLTARQRGGLRWMLAWLERKHSAAYDDVRGEVAADFEKLHEAMTRRLAVYTTEVRVGEPHRLRGFAEVTAELLRRHTSELEEQLGRIAGPDDEETAHEARIAGKRLRYLLEPLRGHAEGAKSATGGMKELQDVLGELHDCAVLGAELGTAIAEAAADRARHDHERAWKGDGSEEARPADARPGLVALSRLVRERRDERFAKLRSVWLEAGSGAWAEPIRRLCAELEAAEPAPARERRFLLRALPELPADATSSIVDQGWIVTPPLIECVRRVRAGHRTRYARVVQTEVLGQPLYAERELGARQFRALWPLTAAARLRVLSHEVGEWKLLEIRGAGVVMASSAGLEPPPWLESFIERDVTDDAAYELRALARRRRQGPARGPGRV